MGNIREFLPNPELPSEHDMAGLGPVGSFSQMAAENVAATRPGKTNFIETETISDAFELVRMGLTDSAVVPIENSTFGPVSRTVDEFVSDVNDLNEVEINGEVDIPVCQYMYYQDPSKVRVVVSHYQALGQTVENLERIFPGIKKEETQSTSEGVLMASRNSEIAGIGSEIAAERQNIENLIRVGPINDNPYNTTRFVEIVKKKGEIEILADPDSKTTMIVYLPDKKGSLYGLLNVFSNNGVNLSQIKSHEEKDGLMPFLMTVNGLQTKNVLNYLGNNVRIKLLGSYPAADVISVPDDAVLNIEQIKDQIMAQRNGENKTPTETELVFTLNDKVGALREILEIFAAQEVNLTKIDSIPSGKLGVYAFFIAFNNGLPQHEALIEEVSSKCREMIKFS